MIPVCRKPYSYQTKTKVCRRQFKNTFYERNSTHINWVIATINVEKWPKSNQSILNECSGFSNYAEINTNSLVKPPNKNEWHRMPVSQFGWTESHSWTIFVSYVVSVTQMSKILRLDNHTGGFDYRRFVYNRRVVRTHTYLLFGGSNQWVRIRCQKTRTRNLLIARVTYYRQYTRNTYTIHDADCLRLVDSLGLKKGI